MAHCLAHAISAHTNYDHTSDSNINLGKQNRHKIVTCVI